MMKKEISVSVSKTYRVAAWKDAPVQWLPALVMVPDSGQKDGISSVFLVDSPDLKSGSGLVLLPTSELDKYFIFSDDGLCPDELSSEFSLMQTYLIECNLPMMGPLFYLRTATMMKYDKSSCDQAIARNKEIEHAMLEWVAKGSTILRSIPRTI